MERNTASEKSVSGSTRASGVYTPPGTLEPLTTADKRDFLAMQQDGEGRVLPPAPIISQDGRGGRDLTPEELAAFQSWLDYPPVSAGPSWTATAANPVLLSARKHPFWRRPYSRDVHLTDALIVTTVPHTERETNSWHLHEITSVVVRGSALWLVLPGGFLRSQTKLEMPFRDQAEAERFRLALSSRCTGTA